MPSDEMWSLTDWMLNKTLNSEGVTSPQFTYLVFAFPISFYATIFPCFGILIVPGVRPLLPKETFRLFFISDVSFCWYFDCFTALNLD